MQNTDTISDSLNRINLCNNPINQGFTMTFPNRITVSIRWGSANYSDGKTTAECAAWDANTHEWIHVKGFDYNGDNVLPRVDTMNIARFIHSASNMSIRNA